MSIVTKRGDDGNTDLLFGDRVTKNHEMIDAVGCLDELNVALGNAKLYLEKQDFYFGFLEKTQKNLFNLMGEVSCHYTKWDKYYSNFTKIEDSDVEEIELIINRIEPSISVNGWAIPGNNIESISFDLARVAARRAERKIVNLHNGLLRKTLKKYINRLSDLLWILARYYGK